MHPWFPLGVLISELTFTREHEVYEEDTDKEKEDDLDGFPEPDNAFNPVHGVKLEYLFQLLTLTLEICSMIPNLQKASHIPEKQWIKAFHSRASFPYARNHPNHPK
jgi:hypothetical protein